VPTTNGRTDVAVGGDESALATLATASNPMTATAYRMNTP
jgi:hypothetical protein